MKKIYFFTCFLISVIGWGQSESSLKNQLQIGLSFQGPDITYQLPTSNKFLLSLGVGGGLTNILIDENGVEFGISTKEDRPFSPFTRVSYRYIYNRHKLLKKKYSTINNRGNYIAFQNKFSFGGKYGTVMINEFHWGMQIPLGRKVVFESHVGLGLFNNLKTNLKKVFPTIGCKFSYVVF